MSSAGVVIHRPPMSSLQRIDVHTIDEGELETKVRLAVQVLFLTRTSRGRGRASDDHCRLGSPYLGSTATCCRNLKHAGTKSDEC